MGSTPPMPAGVRVIPEGASVPNLNPVPFLQGLNPFVNTPLIGGVAQGRGQRQEAPAPTIPTLPSGTPMVGFDAYPTMPQSVASANPRVATEEDIAAFRASNFTRPTQPVAVVPQPVAPVAPEKIGVRTAYGMVYPTRGQEAAAQRLAQMPRMGARLASVRETIVNPKSVKSAIKSIESGGGPSALEGLTKAEKIEVMRNRGRQIAKDINKRNEDYFASQEGGPEPQQQAPVAQRRGRPAQKTKGQTTQRSWSNYIGPNPIQNFDYEET